MARLKRTLHALVVCIALTSCATRPAPSPIPPLPPPSAPPASMRWEDVASLTWPRAPLQPTFAVYGDRVRDAMWGGVYQNGGVEIYCRTRFDADDSGAQHLGAYPLQLEHVYPAERIAEVFGYTTRACDTPIARHPSPNRQRCRAAAADLHNLYPVYAPMNQSRGNLAYAMLPGEGTSDPNYRAFCPDFERGRIGAMTYIEPDAAARGDLARSVIYMYFVYGLPIERVAPDRDTLLSWSAADPVDTEERRREQRIRALQRDLWNPLVMPPGAQS